MDVVVTGASGFVGRAVTRRLRESGVGVTALARRATPGTTLVSDYSQAPTAGVLIHLAESNNRRRVGDAGPEHERDAARTLRALLGKGYRRIVYASSAVLYGDESSAPCHIDAELHVVDAYTRVKRAGELAVLSVDGVVARLANLFGPGMAGANVLSTILGQIPGSGPLRVMDETPVRDFLWIEDAAAAIARMAVASATGVFNIGTGRGTSIGGLAHCALELAGEGDRAVVSTSGASRASRLVVDIERTCSTFDWQPVTTLRDGLATLLRIKQQGQEWASAR